MSNTHIYFYRPSNFISNFISRISVRNSIVLMLIIWSAIEGQCQTVPVSDRTLLDYFRLKQLSGEVDPHISFHAAPVQFSSVIMESDSSLIKNYARDIVKPAPALKFSLLPLNLVQQFNSDRPYGWNDGTMIPAKSYQSRLSAGLFAKLGPLTIQLRPEWVFAANPVYLDGSDQAAANRYLQYLALGYGADIPFYYENKNFSSLAPGQSSIRLNFGPASLGVSTENLWWGPARKNSLLMSNSASGFKHITLNTSRPVPTPIGSLEGQIISGRLESSSFPTHGFYDAEWRYLSGMVFSYQPRWVPTLFLGLSRVFQMYNSDVSGIGDYFPLFQPFEKLKTDEGNKNRDQVTSVFARLLLNKAQAEVYVEYGRNDHSVDIRDFNMEPDHSRAYTVGFQKLTNLAREEEKLLLSVELTQMSQSPTRFVREAGSWYVHAINQGYTHRGEVLGAGIGPGGNIQTLDVNWIKGFKRLGIQFERFVHDDDYYQTLRAGSSGLNGQWVDLSAGILFNWDYKNLLITGKVLGIQSLNYLWQSSYFVSDQQHAFNIHANVGLSYYFK